MLCNFFSQTKIYHYYFTLDIINHHLIIFNVFNQRRNVLAFIHKKQTFLIKTGNVIVKISYI